MESEPTALPASARLASALADRYRIVRELGAGGMATVYLAIDVKHDREVALKVFRPELAAVLGGDRFLNEIRITARLDHPHILTLIDSGSAEGMLYYVVPFVRGESLRQRLESQGQLSLAEALRITTQIAGALEYAHRQGVIHRDVKPENILLQEGEALLCDFGIALAMSQVGGQRLTETGLSLGTPQYMSPEQATGERVLDARADVYSLGAVLYEMLAGDPPHTGSTAQAVIAKLMTERPTRLRVLRDTVPDGVERAVERALAKVPADRYASAGEFATALAEGERAGGMMNGAAMRRALARGLRSTAMRALGVAAIVAVLAAVVFTGRGPRHGPLSLSNHIQLTSTGRIGQLAISADGKQLAYATRGCDTTGCSEGVELENADGSAARRILADTATIYQIAWSPDQRNLIVGASVSGRSGSYLVSTVGGPARYLTGFPDGFWADGDSMLLITSAGHDGVAWIDVSGLDGIVRDSIRIPDAGEGLASVMSPRGTPWIIVGISRPPMLELRVIDRAGRERDRTAIASEGWFRVSSDAVWWRQQQGPLALLLRRAFDARTGRISAPIDTLTAGNFSSFDVTANGGKLAATESFKERDGYALTLGDLLRGALPPKSRLFQRVTTSMQAIVSPDGSRVLLFVSPSPGVTSRLSIVPFGGGAETVFAAPTRAGAMGWVDSTAFAFVEGASGRERLLLMDMRTGARRDEFAPTDSAVQYADALPGGGWTWLTADGHDIKVQRKGEASARTIPKPDWYGYLTQLRVSPDGSRLAVLGWNASNGDTAGVSVMSLADGATTSWATAAGDGSGGGSVQWLADRTLFFQVPTEEGAILYRARAAGRTERLGRISGGIRSLSVSADLRRATAVIATTRGDAWAWDVRKN